MLANRAAAEQNMTPTLTGDGGMHFIFGDTIDFTRLTWEAFAAFIAVIAAALVGWRQVGIQKRQAAMQHLELRRLLFDQRLPVYLATQAWLGLVLETGSIPSMPRSLNLKGLTQEARIKEVDRQISIDRAFVEALEMSRFVFSPHVFEALEELWLKGNQLHFHQASQVTEGKERDRHIDAEFRLHKWFADRHANLAAVFGDELKVSDGGKSTFRPLAKPEHGA